MRRRSIESWPLAGDGAAVGAAARRAFVAVLFSIAWLPGPLPGGEGVPDGTDQGTVLIGEGHVWRFFRGTQAPPADWNQPGFDDSAWEQGPTGIGYGDGDDRTVLEDMRCVRAEGTGEDAPCAGGYLAFFARTTFDSPEVPPDQRLLVKVSYDDGFVLYLNGVAMKRVNMPDGEVSWKTAAVTAIGDAPASPDAVIVIPAELLRAGANVLAASVHNVNLTSSDASFIPRLIIGRLDEPAPEPSCKDRCAARAAEVAQRCIAEGLSEKDCAAKKAAVLEECLRVECGIKPPEEPTCEGKCEEGAAKAFQICREGGGSEDQCRDRKLEFFRQCVESCDKPPTEKPCDNECAASGNAVFVACVEAGGDKEDCRRRADGIVALCLERCGTGTPCEDRCAVAAQIVLTGCSLAELPAEECKRMANSVLERCAGGCVPPPSCESRCDELAQRAVEECKGRGGPEEECAAGGAAVLAECRAHCGGEPVPDCDRQCEGKAKELYEGCVAGGKPEADCQAERDAFLARCKEELADVCKQEGAALQSTFQLFERGDSNRDGQMDLSDSVAILGYLFLGSQALRCEDAADANDDGVIDISDPVLILGHLFLGNGSLPAPFGEKGHDPTSDLLLCAF